MYLILVKDRKRGEGMKGGTKEERKARREGRKKERREGVKGEGKR